MIRRYDLDDWEDPKRDRNRSYSVHDVRELLADQGEQFVACSLLEVLTRDPTVPPPVRPPYAP